MADFAQTSPVTTLHDLGTVDNDELEERLVAAAREYRMGLILPVTDSDMRSDPFLKIMEQLELTEFIDTVCIVLNRAPNREDYEEAHRRTFALGSKAHLLWLDGPRCTALLNELIDADFPLDTPGKGRAVWFAFGYLLADPSLKAYALHDCDIVDYHRDMLARLCFPMAQPSLDFDYCKAFYARCTDRMHGRVARLLVAPLLKALLSMYGNDDYLTYMAGFRYPLSGEFAVTSTLARYNRIPSDWGLEVGTLAEVFRNTSLKRVCQVDLGRLYEHKHQALSLGDPNKGLMKMALDILTNVIRTLASRGIILEAGHFRSLRSGYLRTAQDAIRQYHADALINGLSFDRHAEEQAVEGFASQIPVAGEEYFNNPSGAAAIPNWTRVLTAFPDFPQRLRQAAQRDAEEFSV